MKHTQILLLGQLNCGVSVNDAQLPARLNQIRVINGRKIISSTTPLSWQEAVTDICEQLSQLVYPGFISTDS